MKKSKFTDEQIAFTLKQTEVGTPIAEITRRLGVTEATFYRWKQKYGGLLPSEVKKMRLLEEENTRLKLIVADELFDGRRIRILTIVDNFNRESLCVSANFRYKGLDVATALETVSKAHGMPEIIKVDNGPEFISKEVDLWAYAHRVKLDFSRPGKLTDNAFIECLDFFSGRSAKIAKSWIMTT